MPSDVVRRQFATRTYMPFVHVAWCVRSRSVRSTRVVRAYDIVCVRFRRRFGRRFGRPGPGRRRYPTMVVGVEAEKLPGAAPGPLPAEPFEAKRKAPCHDGDVPSDDQREQPSVEQAARAHAHHHASHEDFVGQGVQVASQDVDGVCFSGSVAVEPVCEGGYDEAGDGEGQVVGEDEVADGRAGEEAGKREDVGEIDDLVLFVGRRRFCRFRRCG